MKVQSLTQKPQPVVESSPQVKQKAQERPPTPSQTQTRAPVKAEAPKEAGKGHKLDVRA